MLMFLYIFKITPRVQPFLAEIFKYFLDTRVKKFYSHNLLKSLLVNVKYQRSKYNGNGKPQNGKIAIDENIGGRILSFHLFRLKSFGL